MTWARSLSRPLRLTLGALLHWGREAAAELGAVGPDDPRGRRFGQFGQGSVLAFPQGAVYNERYIHIGTGTMVGPYACLTAGMAPGQQMASDPVVRIGDRCVIGRGTHVVGHWSIEIGNDVQTGPYVYVTDQNHSYQDPDQPVGTQWPVESAVRIGSGSWLGAHAVVLPGTDLGRNVVVAAGAVVRGRFPDHCVVAGVPARIVRRWLPDRGWVDADGAATGAATGAGADARTGAGSTVAAAAGAGRGPAEGSDPAPEPGREEREETAPRPASA